MKQAGIGGKERPKSTMTIVLNGIIAAGVERMAAQETADGKEHAPAGSICGNGLVRELRAGGGKTARLPEEGRNANLICPNRGEQHLLDHTPLFVRRTGASSSRTSW